MAAGAIFGGVLLLVSMICVGLTLTRLADWVFYRRPWTLPLLVVLVLSGGISLLNKLQYGEFVVRGVSPLHDPAEFLVMIFFCVLVFVALPTIALLLIGLAGYRLAPRRKQLQAASNGLSGQGSSGVEASPFDRLSLGFRWAHVRALISMLLLFCGLVPTGLLEYLPFRKTVRRTSRNEAGEITELHLRGRIFPNSHLREVVTGAGLKHLTGLTKLYSLNLKSTQVTDAGLVHLKRLTKLMGLNLSFAQVTDAGVAGRKKALPKCDIQH